ncbi:MAG: gliding motility lipoprotein GldH [Phycisphaerales bacterium]|nr:gliding motility lipoprotein GldH [Phycisphaerales bacterium]
MQFVRVLFYCWTLVFLYACSSRNNFIENYQSFPNHRWASNDKVNIPAVIPDSVGHYNLYLLLRCENSYEFNNIWLKITAAYGDTAFSMTKEFILMDNHHWLGNVYRDVIELQLPITTQPIRLKAGSYQFMLEQVMRQNPLKGVLNVGMMIERTDTSSVYP